MKLSLCLITEHGNTTTYEYTYGEAPLKIEEPVLDIKFDDEVNNTGDGIDFGSDSAAIDFGAEGVIDFGGEGGVIDFGAEIELTSTGDIDWGNIESAETVDPAQVILTSNYPKFDLT
jgi:hypothetical protein